MDLGTQFYDFAFPFFFNHKGIFYNVKVQRIPLITQD